MGRIPATTNTNALKFYVPSSDFLTAEFPTYAKVQDAAQQAKLINGSYGKVANDSVVLIIDLDKSINPANVK